MAVSNQVWKVCLVFFILTGFSHVCALSAQSTINSDPEVDRMLEVFAEKNKSVEFVKAWRIQIGAMTERRKMESEMERFKNIYPYYQLEWTYDNPYYLLKIRDRAYKDKLEALGLLHELKNKYPSAIVILDDVKKEDLLKMSSR